MNLKGGEKRKTIKKAASMISINQNSTCAAWDGRGPREESNTKEAMFWSYEGARATEAQQLLSCA
jgi:DNA-binding protein H-NS